jgi:predicted transcriptional regulator
MTRRNTQSRPTETLSTRVDEDVAVVVDHLAGEAGQTRARWLRDAIVNRVLPGYLRGKE